MCRPSCARCVIKHLSEAVINYSESKLGYPLYWALVVGQLAEAELESLEQWPQLANKIREERLKYMDDRNNYCPKLMDLIEWADTLLEEVEAAQANDDKTTEQQENQTDTQTGGPTGQETLLGQKGGKT